MKGGQSPRFAPVTVMEVVETSLDTANWELAHGCTHA